MVLIMNCLIYLPANRGREALQIRNVHKVSIKSSLSSFTDTANVELIGSAYYKGSNTPLEELVKAGDPIEVYLRYDRHSEATEFVNENLEFVGFIKRVYPQNPVVLECEDYSYLLKNKAISKPISIRKGTLKQLLKLALPDGISFDSVDAQIGNYVCSQKTSAQLLDDIKKDYGLISNFRDRTLIVGQIYFGRDQKPVAIYRFGQNVKKDNLAYENREQNPLVIVKSKIKGQKKSLEARSGQEGGKEMTVKLDGIADKKLLQEIADRRFELLTRTVLKGSITGFGFPIVHPGDVVKLENARFAGFDGKSFFIDTVNQEFSSNGWERTVELGKMLNK